MCVTSILICFSQFKARSNAGKGRGGASARGNQFPPHAPAKGVAMQVNLAGLTNAEVWTALAHMNQAITMQY